MKKTGIDLLIEKWLNEPGFRDKMKKDPEGVVKKTGIALSAEEWSTVKNVVMSTSDAELRKRVSKGQNMN